MTETEIRMECLKLAAALPGAAIGDDGQWVAATAKRLADFVLDNEPRPAVHLSDCAVHNGPALPVGPCDCGAAGA